MAWVVKPGVRVSHNGQDYVAGDAVPCTDAEAAQMPHAVSLVVAEPEAPVVMVAEVPAEPVVLKVEKPSKRSK